MGRKLAPAGKGSRLGTHDVVELQLLPPSLLDGDVFACPTVEGGFHATVGPGLWVTFTAFLLFLTPFPGLPARLRRLLHHA